MFVDTRGISRSSRVEVNNQGIEFDKAERIHQMAEVHNVNNVNNAPGEMVRDLVSFTVLVILVPR